MLYRLSYGGEKGKGDFFLGFIFFGGGKQGNKSFLDTECIHLLLAPKLILRLALLFLKLKAFGALLLSLNVLGMANSHCHLALGKRVSRRVGKVVGRGRGIVGRGRGIVGRLGHNRHGAGLTLGGQEGGRRLGHILRGSGGSVTKVDEGGGAIGARLPLLRERGSALGDHPIPGVVVDDLDLIASIKLRPNLHRRVVLVVPRTEVHKHAGKLLALLVLLGHHVHALHEPELKRVHDGADALLRDVAEDPGDADAVDDGLGIARGALLGIARGALLGIARGALLGTGTGVAVRRRRHF